MYLSPPRNLPPMPHPTHISLPPSSPYPLSQLSNIIWFISGRSWSCIVRSDTKRASFLVVFFWVRLGTKWFLFGYPRNEKRQKSFPLSLQEYNQYLVEYTYNKLRRGGVPIQSLKPKRITNLWSQSRSKV